MPAPVPVVVIPPDRVDGKVHNLTTEWTTIIINEERAVMSSWMIYNRSDREVDWAFGENVDATKIFRISPGASRSMSVQVAHIYARIAPGQQLADGEIVQVEAFTFFLPEQCAKAGDNVSVR